MRAIYEFPSGNLGRPVSVKKASPTIVLRGVVAVPADTSFPVVYAKLLPPPGRAIESVCSWLGRAGSVSIPAPMFAIVHRNKLPDQHAWPYTTDSEICFASVEVPGALTVDRFDSLEILRRLVRWPQLLDAAVFDYLIANDDRWDQNMLLDGKGQFWLIDHQRSLGGAGGSLFSKEFFPSFRSPLFEHVLEHYKSDMARLRSEVIQSCARICAPVHRIPYERLLVEPEIASQIALFLTRRAEVLSDLILNVLGIPELFQGLGPSQRPSIQ